MPHKDEDQLRKEIRTLLNTENAPEMPPEVSDSIRRTILELEASPAAASTHRVHFLRTAWFRYAAVVLLIAGAGIYLYLNKINTGSEKPILAKTDLPPGKSGAILTLADGRTIVLDTIADGVIASDNGTQLLLTNGQLAYNITDSSLQGNNTMTTPKGRMFQLLLPDGSRVWLNAASSITYPTAFTGNERRVTIKGEAYFEIAADSKAPFRVTTGETTIDVLGTSFDVMGYEDEKHIKTTLLEGKVKVAQGAPSVVLAPGQQALTSASRGISSIPVQAVDIEQTVAWKNGLFAFKDSDLTEVMRQISRWYNVEVEFDDNVPVKNINGNTSRNYKLAEVMKMLEFTSGIHYTLENNKIILHR